jgi:hypothetical protein
MYYRVDSNGKEILVLQIIKIYPVNPVYSRSVVKQKTMALGLLKTAAAVTGQAGRQAYSNRIV